MLDDMIYDYRMALHIALVKTVDLSLPPYASGGIGGGEMQPPSTNTPKLRPYNDDESAMAMMPISNWQVLRPPIMLPY